MRRADVVVAERFGLGRRMAARMIDRGLVRAAGRTRLKKGDLIDDDHALDIDAQHLGEWLVPRAVEGLSVILEAEDFVVVDKPAGIASHPLVRGEGQTVADGVAHLFAETITASEDPREGGLVHRLDTATSGALLVARSRAAWTRLRAALADEEVARRYLALTERAPTPGWFERPVNGQPARTLIEIAGEVDGRVLLKLRLEGGRRHQLRRHLAELGCPIVGDERYGGAVAERLYLHAYEINVEGRTAVVAAPAGFV